MENNNDKVWMVRVEDTTNGIGTIITALYKSENNARARYNAEVAKSKEAWSSLQEDVDNEGNPIPNSKVIATDDEYTFEVYLEGYYDTADHTVITLTEEILND